MELKPATVHCSATSTDLLIVPYGIETVKPETPLMPGELLIVPYGIETAYACTYDTAFGFLLIVPYGIETSSFA